MARSNGGLNPDLVRDVADAVGANRCVVAMGGGADSSVLLAAAAEASGADNVRAVFVFHHLEASDRLRSAALAVANHVGVTATVLDAPVVDGPDLEARARGARYDVMEQFLDAGEVGLTAHTRDDQAETVLMHLMRGSGTTGLAGIPASRGPWRRPFLDRTKDELRDVADTLGLPYVDDPANADLRFMRSRIRTRVMPYLEAELGWSVRDGMAKTAALLAADDKLLTAQTRDVAVSTDGDRVFVPTAPLFGLPPAVTSRIARTALRSVMGGHPGSADDVAQIQECLETGGTRQLTQGVMVYNLGPHLMIGTPPEPIDGVSVHVGGSFRWANDTFRTYRTDVAPPVVGGGRFTLLNADAVGDKFDVRGAQPGDRLRIEDGSTPVKELLRSNGVPVPMRSVSPLVLDDAKIAALVGVRTAAWASPQKGRPVVVIERELDQ